MKVYSWGRKGWNSQEKEIKSNVRSKIPYKQAEFINDGKSNLSKLASISDEVQLGSPLEKIDDLPQALRMVYESPYDFYLTGNGKLFRVVDPVTQAYAYGDWGADQDEADEDILEDKQNTLRRYLEQSKVIEPTSSTETMFDAMDYIISNDLQIENDGQIISNDSVGTILPEISEEKVEAVQKAQVTYKENLSKTDDPKQKELLTLAFEQALDSILNKEMVLNLSSPFTANRYSQPSKRFEILLSEGHSDLTEAKQEREKFFIDLFKELSDCDSAEALYGPVNPIEGGRCFEDGILYRISKMYYHDKEICTDWSINPILNADGQVEKDSAFNIQARKYLKELRSKDLDEETIRRRMNARFFNTNHTIPAEYDDNGDIISPTIKIKDSWFHRNRARALKNLFLTKAQWAGVYQLIDLVKARAKVADVTEDERKAAIELKEKLDTCETLKDLGEYRKLSEKREFIYASNEDGVKFNTYRFTPSLVDRLSKINEQRWWKEVIKKHRELVGKGTKNA